MVTQSSRTSPLPAQANRAAAQAVRRAACRVIPLLALGYVVSYIDRANISFAALTMNHDLGLSAAQFGFIAGIFYVGYCLFEVPSNLALLRLGARRWLARIMITWGLAAAATSVAQGPVSLGIFRFLTGACEAGFYPGVMFYLSTWFPIEVRSRAFAWFIVANPMSSVISGPLSTTLLRMDGIAGVAGWRWLLLCEGLPACLLGLYTLFTLPDTPRDARWLTEEQKDALEEQLAMEEHPGAERNLWAPLRHPQVLILSFSYFCAIVGLLGITLWLPQMLHRYSLSMRAIGLTAALPYLLASVGLIIWSYRMDRTRAFLSNYVGTCLCAAIGFAFSAAVDSLPALLAGISVALIGMNACRPALFSLLPAFLQGTAAAAGMAFVSSIGSLGGLVGPSMIGWLNDATGSYTVGLFGLSGMLGLAALSALLIKIVKPP